MTPIKSNELVLFALFISCALIAVLVFLNGALLLWAIVRLLFG